MFVDMMGNARVKLCLHISSAFSEGELTPNEIAELYMAEGYDAISITDRWIYGEECELSGLLVLSGAEYCLGDAEDDSGAYHIVGVGMTSDPEIPYDWQNMKKTVASKAEQVLEKIRFYNGFSFIAHPALCNTAARRLVDICNFDGIEIFSASSAHANDDKSCSNEVVNELAKFGVLPLVIASDDAKKCTNELFCGAVMVEAAEMSSASIVRGLKAGRFYSTEGPEVHITADIGGRVRVQCSPCSRIQFFTMEDETGGKIFEGEGLVEAEYFLKESENFVRAEVTDSLGCRAWTNYLLIEPDR